ncbi:phage tail tube protein [Paracoccus litorisediminis]|uniref:Uncharacterized protein n=1 Tax=Paracoccus litorisediminis TaxID=2006130 RepID=A0A844HSH2_9RHOB|nr:phage tail tube protein [Paracoccus litorisediminis]MTH62109.1 hypothetical protein [Paracoccus litorisediminis]
MARAQGARAQLALGFETVYGTPPVAGNFWQMPFASSGLGAEQPLLSSELLGYGRDPLAPVLDAVTADGDVVVPIDQRFIGIWLKALFGSPTSTGSTGAYTHTYQSGGWSLPSMSIEVGNPEVPSYRMLKGVVANSINWQMARSGLVTATVNCMAQGETPAAASAAGVLGTRALNRFGAFHGGISMGGSQLANVVSGSVNYSNNLERVETIRADGLIEGCDPGQATLTGEVTVRFADTTLLTQALSGAPVVMAFSYTDGTRSLTLTAHAVYLPRPRIQLDGPGGIQATFNWQAAQAASPARMATVVLVNDMPNFQNP